MKSSVSPYIFYILMNNECKDKNMFAIMLFAFLVVSIILNVCQVNRILKLTEENKNLEYILQVLKDEIDELETTQMRLGLIETCDSTVN